MSELFAWIRAALSELAAALWALLALLLDAYNLGSLGSALVVALLAATALGVAHLMQRRLVRRLRADPSARLTWRQHEAWFFLPAWLVLPFVLLGRLLTALWRWLVGLVRKRNREESSADDDSGAQQPFLAASLGPSFLLAGLVTAFVYLLVRVADPFLTARLGLTPGSSAWEYLFLGQRPELGPHLPVARTAPFLATVLLVLFWLTVWWTAARFVRLFHWRHLGGNLLAQRDRPEVLSTWRRWAAVPHLVVPTAPYRVWAGTLTAVALPLLAWGWFTLGDVPYRASPGDLAIALVLWLAWAAHLTLAGGEHRPDVEEESPETAAASVAGWPEVCADLRIRLQIDAPEPCRPPRPVGELTWEATSALDDPLLSPVLGELIPENSGRRRLTPMQLAELQRLSRLGHVFTRPTPARGELVLGTGESEAELKVRERNRIVLAPEGFGKTTLALLAATNHALVHTRASLLVTRDEEQAEALYERIHRLLDPSTLRWNLRLRRVGADLVEDLSRGILPDLVVTSLHRLVVSVLAEMDTYAPLLHRLGLLVVDDVESYAGPVEIHAQLAFRRLTLAARKLLGVEQFGEEGKKLSPLVLALGSESMQQMPVWTGTLLGIDAEVERYSAAADPRGRRQQVFLLSDFRAATGERLEPAELVASCENLGVAWHYRPCVDGRRHVGRSALLLHDEPRHYTTDPCRAAVVLLDGAWSEVQREIERLRLAGSRHPGSPCALVTRVDPDEEMSFTQHDGRLSLAGEVAVLPRPVLRPPTGRTVGSHLATDLTQSWTEVADVLDTFGNAVAHKLRQLADEGLLLTEHRVDVGKEGSDYENKLHVRALAGAVAEGREDDSRSPLPPRVDQVELAGRRGVDVLDRTDLDRIVRVDADSAGLAYYPGRVFADARGRFVVVHHAVAEGGEGAAARGDRPEIPAGSILVEPLLGDDVSSPRRRVRVEAVAACGEPEKIEQRHRQARQVQGLDVPELLNRGFDPATTGHAFYGPDPVRIGELPIEVELSLLRLHCRHFATYLLGPTFCEVRQRRLFTGGEGLAAEGSRQSRLTTVAVRIYPNPTPPPEGENDGDGVPRLTLRQARLVAAALRAVLPSMYRGAGSSLGVSLDVHHPDPKPEYVLAPWDSFVLFDLHSLGNGTARALYRDGVELLLRLARMHLERVLYHDRLLALHDHWANGPGEWDLYAAWPENGMSGTGEDNGIPANEGGNRDGEASPLSPANLTRQRRGYEEELRHKALEWLDSRLRPEGDAAAFSGSLGRRVVDAEKGEGDVIDIGRCWYSPALSVADLAWAKHRWRLHDGDEVMLDVAFERSLLAAVRHLDADSPLLAHGIELHRKHLTDGAFVLPDHRVWGAPREVWRVEGEEDEPHSSQPGLAASETLDFHALVAGVAAHDLPLLAPLATKLRQYALVHAEKHGLWGGDGTFHLVAYVASFVQGIPTLPRPQDGPPLLRSAVPTLLERRGDLNDKALLLALLLTLCDVPSGLLVSFAERRTLVAAALTAPVDLRTATVTVHRDEEGKFAAKESSTGQAEQYARSTRAAKLMFQQIESWAEQVHLGSAPRFWCELPPDLESEAGTQLYVPLETAALRRPGRAVQGRPESWLFLPLVSVLHGLLDTKRKESSDKGTQQQGEEAR